MAKATKKIPTATTYDQLRKHDDPAIDLAEAYKLLDGLFAFSFCYAISRKSQQDVANRVLLNPLYQRNPSMYPDAKKELGRLLGEEYVETFLKVHAQPDQPIDPKAAPSIRGLTLYKLRKHPRLERELSSARTDYISSVHQTIERQNSTAELIVPAARLLLNPLFYSNPEILLQFKKSLEKILGEGQVGTFLKQVTR